MSLPPGSRWTMTDTLLILAILLALATLAASLSWQAPKPPAGEAPDVAAADAGPAPSQDAAQAAIARALSRALFEPDRRALSAVRLPGATAVPDSGAAPPVLVGVMPGAALFAGAGGHPIKAVAGDHVDGWRVVAIDGLRVTLERGQRRLTADLAAAERQSPTK